MVIPGRVTNNIYEINARQWLNTLSLEKGKKITISDVPVSFWEDLNHHGIDMVWLMGIWHTTPSSIPVYCFDIGLKSSYSAVLSDWKPEDVGGSPYAIDDYKISPLVGDEAQIQQLRRTLHKLNIKLILDYIPNHFNAHSSLLSKHPEIFISGGQTEYDRHPSIYYKRNEHFWAHGKDPYFPAWTDTVQVNYFKEAARDFMQSKLLKLASLCDGVRCDMAMLVINRIFNVNWSSVTQSPDGFLEQSEFWTEAINTVKQAFPEFLFIAEVYWNLEAELQQLGFDYTYDKRLLDFLYKGSVPGIKEHLKADQSFQSRSTRFIENHDETRMTSRLSMERTHAAAIISYTLPGMRLFFHGQWEGSRKRTPVQLLRIPVESACPCSLRSSLKEFSGAICSCQAAFYKKLISIMNSEIYRKGDWRLNFETRPENSILSWKWSWEDKIHIIVINYSDQFTIAKVGFHTKGKQEVLDVLNDSMIVLNSVDGFISLDLPSYKSRIIEIKKTQMA
jgi:hypothetical protein